MGVLEGIDRGFQRIDALLSEGFTEVVLPLIGPQHDGSYESETSLGKGIATRSNTPEQQRIIQQRLHEKIEDLKQGAHHIQRGPPLSQSCLSKLCPRVCVCQ